MAPEVRVFLTWVLVGLVFLLAALTYRVHAVNAQRLTDEQRVARDGCEYVKVEFLEPMSLGVMNGVRMPYPGGWHWLVECPSGASFHVRVPRP